MKVSSFIIAMVVVSMFVTVMALFYADLAVDYSVTYDNDTFSAYNQLSALNNQTKTINQTISGIDPSTSSTTDLVGGFLKSGYEVLKVTWGSFGIFTDITQDAGDKMSEAIPGNSFSALRYGIIMIALLLFLFAIISVLVGRDV